MPVHPGPRQRSHPGDSHVIVPLALFQVVREHGGEPSSRQVDKLLDERLAHRGRAGEDAAVDT